MTQLLCGIKIIPSADFDLQCRAELSSGVQAATELFTDASYCSHAFVPKSPWRKLTNHEKHILFDTRDFPTQIRGDWVSIIKLPNQILSKVLPVAQIKNQEELDQVLQTPVGQGVVKTLQHFVGMLTENGEVPIKYGIGCNQPNLTTVTITENCYEGLHIDRGDGLLLDERPYARNRLMLNLGAEPRYLLFINLGIRRLYNLVTQHDVNLHKDTFGMSHLGLTFMKLYHDYPVVRLKVEPGEAYIAPTDNIIHDGSTEGTDSVDTIFTVRSNFELDSLSNVRQSHRE